MIFSFLGATLKVGKLRRALTLRATRGFSVKSVTLFAVLAMSLSIITFPLHAHSDSTASHRLNLPSGILVAQSDDSYDPFADYSEFDEAVDEEEDLNFFRNGRLLTLGFLGGLRSWTGSLGKIYSSDMSFGLFLCYFFDLRFALQFGFLTSDHVLSVSGPGFTPVRGTVNMTDLAANLKYYFNTQNVTRGLADLNPYLLGGFSQIYRTTTVSNELGYGKDSAFAFNIGGGIEIPAMRNKLFFGAQAMFQYVMFSNESNIIVDTDEIPTGVTPNGDSFTLLGVLGVNF